MILFAVLACYGEDYHTLTPEDHQALNFIERSYVNAVVVDIEGILLSVLRLRTTNSLRCSCRR